MLNTGHPQSSLAVVLDLWAVWEELRMARSLAQVEVDRAEKRDHIDTDRSLHRRPVEMRLAGQEEVLVENPLKALTLEVAIKVAVEAQLVVQLHEAAALEGT